MRFLDQYFFRDDIVWLGAATNDDFINFVKSAFTVPSGQTPYWRPLSDFYFFGMYRVFAADALPYNLANLLLHAGTASATALFIRQVTRSPLTGLIAGALFAVAPAYGTGIVWISTAGTLIAALFSVATVILFLRSLGEHEHSASRYAALAAFVLALLAQEASIAIPAVLLILGIATRPVRNAAEYRRFAVAIAPFVIIGAAVIGLRIWSAYFTEMTGHELDYHAISRLADRLRWLSLPLSPEYGDWVDTAQWLALILFTAAAAATALRRNWLPPALYASTVTMLLPSSVIDGIFEARLVYVAAPYWAGFVSLLVMILVRWSSTRHVLAGAAMLLVVAAGVGLALLPRDTEVQRGLAAQAAQMEDIKNVVHTECPGLQSHNTVFLLQLPVNDPSYFVYGLVYLVTPRSSAVRIEAAGLPDAQRGDCLVEWRDERYQAMAIEPSFAEGGYWTEGLRAPCPDALDWADAPRLPDRLVNVTGPVLGVRSYRGGTILNVGDEDKLRIYIPARTRRPFPPAEVTYANRTICARGFVRVVLGVATITLDVPETIVVAPKP